LDTTELDEEITRRVLLQPQMWPDFFGMMERAGAVDDARREQQLDIERVEDERTDPNMETLNSATGAGQEHERSMLGRRSYGWRRDIGRGTGRQA
jgi:hypothetical protein